MTYTRFSFFLGSSVALHFVLLGYALFIEDQRFAAQDSGKSGLDQGLGLQVSIVELPIKQEETKYTHEAPRAKAVVKPALQEAEHVLLDNIAEKSVSNIEVPQEQSEKDSRATSATITGQSDLEHYGGQAGRVQAYLAVVMSELHKHKHYNRIARSRGLEGVATLEFTIERDGHLSSLLVSRSSGYKLIDESALEMFLNAAPFPDFPADMAEERIQDSLPIEFALR